MDTSALGKLEQRILELADQFEDPLYGIRPDELVNLLHGRYNLQVSPEQVENALRTLTTEGFIKPSAYQVVR